MICRAVSKLALLLFTCVAFLFPGVQQANGQDAPNPTARAESDDVRTLMNVIRNLQDQVETLASQVREIRAEQEQDRADAREWRDQLAKAAEQRDYVRSAAIKVFDSTLSPFASAPQDVQPSVPTEDVSEIEKSVTRLEENQQLLDDKISEQSQTKVESGSKYRVRLSGIVLLEMFDNRGTVDNQDFPAIAMTRTPAESPGAFGGSLRQSQIGIETFGPDFAGAHTSASLKFDFAGGFPNEPNGVSMGLVRLRTGTVRLDWANTSLIAGQDELFFSPLAPTSLASLAVPALSYSGNLWSWTPQIRIEHRVSLPARSVLLLQGGILDSLSGEVPQSTYQSVPTLGEQSGQPAYAGRVSWTIPAFGENFTFGTGGYYGRQGWGFSRNINAWASTLDMTLPLGTHFEFSGQFYRGRSLGGLNGAIGQDVLFSGPVENPGSIVEGLDSMGGWAQLKFKPREKFEINSAFGIDNPFSAEMRRFPATQTFYGVLLTKNLSPLVNFIYQVRSNVLFSMEYRRLQTFVLSGTSPSANHATLSVGYVF